MYFLNKNGDDAVENCPSCSSAFVIDKGAECPNNCSAKKLEKKHEKATKKMVKYCLSYDKEVKIIFPRDKLPLEEDREGKTKIKWGLTYDFKQLIEIPWYTLRSKKEFFNAIAHETAHISAYKEKFNLPEERKIIYNFENLCLEYNSLEYTEDNEFYLQSTSTELIECQTRYEEIIGKYRGWESRGHDYKFWYREYLRIFNELIKSSFVKYAYGNTKSRSYGFDKHGKGKYDAQK